MTRALLRLALLLAPSEFRDHYGVQIDAAGDRGFSVRDILDIAVTGLRLRWEDFVRDVAYALRRLSNAPLFVSIVVLTFALGIGANVAVFSVLNAVVLKPLPFKDANGIVVIFDGVRGGASVPGNLSLADPLDMRTVPGIAATTALASDGGTLLARNAPFGVTGLDVIPDYFNILGITPELGRVLVPADSDPGVHDIDISDDVWRAHFNADPGVIGETVRLNGVPERIVGVLKARQPALDPSGSLAPQDYYAALPERATLSDREERYLGGFARLAPGASIASTNAQLAILSARLQKLYPTIDHQRVFSVATARSELLGSAASVLWIVFAAVVGILLIACANVGNLLGARWSTRDRELAVRRALGASSWRIGAQLLIEAGVLATAGAVAGIGLAYGALRALSGLLANALPRAETIHIDGVSLLFAVGVVVAATLMAAVTPLLSLGNPDLQGVLKTAGRGGDASSHHRLRSALVVLEIALALALVVISGLTVRSFVNLIDSPLGIRPNGVIASGLTVLPEKDLGTLSARAAMQRDLLARLQALPGVKAATLAEVYPLGPMANRSNAPVFGRTYPIGSEPHATLDNITPDYFRVLGIPLLRGRAFDSGDRMGTTPVAIVNTTFVRRFLQGMNPIGVRIRTEGWNGTQTSWSTIVGVAGDERDTIARPPYPAVYVPMSQGPAAYTSALVYAPEVDAAVVASEMKGAFRAVLPTVQPPDMSTVAQLVGARTAQERFATILLTTLACIALVLALSGIFGVISFSVTQRSREFGVRMALGATEPAVLADVLRRTLVTTAIGVAIGLLIAAVAARIIAGQLGSISPFDPMTFGFVSLLIFFAAMLASLQPALRATRIQPVEALRYE